MLTKELSEKWQDSRCQRHGAGEKGWVRMNFKESQRREAGVRILRLGPAHATREL